MALIRQFLSRLFRRRPSGTLVGADEHGNRYYERIMPGYPTKRWMEPPGGSLNPSAYDTDKVPGTQGSLCDVNVFCLLITKCNSSLAILASHAKTRTTAAVTANKKRPKVAAIHKLYSIQMMEPHTISKEHGHSDT
jgi:hypothetical protein